MERKRLYSLLTVLIAVCSVLSMIYFMNMSYAGDDNNDSIAYNMDDNKYIGYIFDDYNKNVNLGYSENSSESEDNIINVISLQSVDMAYTADNMRAVRSERLIDERALRNGDMGQ